MRLSTTATLWIGALLAGCVTSGEVTPTRDATGAPSKDHAQPESAGPPGPAIPSTALAARPMHDGRVLISLAAKPEWAVMPLTSAEEIEYHGTWKLEVGVDVDALPPELGDLLAGSLDLYGPVGKLCTVTPDRLAIEAHVLPADSYASLDSERLWQMVERPGEDDEVAVLLVAGFAADPRCDGALWARDARLPPPTVLHRARTEDVVARIAEERARVLDSEHGRELADQYSRYLDSRNVDGVPNAAPWSTYAEGTGQVWIDDGGDPRLLVVTFGEGLSKPCFSVPAYTDTRPIDGEGPWPYPLWGLPTPQAVFDADLDGRYELLFVREWGSLINLDVVSETLGVELALPDDSEMNC